MNAVVLARFLAKTRDSDTCWEWVGALDQDGYGIYTPGTGARARRAHRLSYEHFVGGIPTGRTLDHLCRVRSCVNPEHLEPVTNAENIRRGLTGIHNAVKTHCANGHEYTPENTYIRTYTHNGRTHRICRTCVRQQNRAQYERRSKS